MSQHMIIPRKDINHFSFSNIYKAIAFDADKTLRYTINSKYPFPVDGTDWEFMPNVLNVMHTYYTPRSAIRYAIITNQSGIANGTVMYGPVKDMLNDLATAVFKNREVDIYVCHHNKDAQCPCRKPSPYSLLRFAFTRNLRLDEILYVGDSMNDFVSADRAGINFVWSVDFFGW